MSEVTAKDRNGKEIRAGSKVRVYGASQTGMRYVGPAGADGVIQNICPGNFANVQVPGVTGELWNTWATSSIELLESNDELESLVRKANEGLEASKRLNTEFLSQVQERATKLDGSVYYDWKDLQKESYNTYAVWAEYRVKPKKTFTPFTVGKGWNVSLSEDQKRLTIGCQEFNGTVGYNPLSQNFKDVRDRGAERYGLTGAKDFVFHQPTGHKLSWDEFEKIIKALEDVGA